MIRVQFQVMISRDHVYENLGNYIKPKPKPPRASKVVFTSKLQPSMLRAKKIVCASKNSRGSKYAE